MLATSHDQASRFVRVLTAGQRTHLVPEDLVPLVQDVVETHPGLNFLKEAIEFHSRYVHTVRRRFGVLGCMGRATFWWVVVGATLSGIGQRMAGVIQAVLRQVRRILHKLDGAVTSDVTGVM